MKKIILIILLFMMSNVSYGQEILYINADNGLIIREKPNKKSHRIGKFEYADKIEILEKTGIKFSIIDNSQKINGEWFKVEGIIDDKVTIGYVFSGYLIKNKLINDILEIPEIGKFNLKSMKVNRTHKYSAGDSEGRITELSSEQNIISIDSTSAGEYGYNNTIYLFNQQKVLLKVYQSNWYSIMNESRNKYIYVVTETVSNFKDSKPIKLERKDTLNTHFFDKYPEPLAKKYQKVEIGKEDLSFWNNFYFETWKMKYENN